MGEESEQAIEELIKNLEKIPKNIVTTINVEKISKLIAQELGKKLSL